MKHLPALVFAVGVVCALNTVANILARHVVLATWSAFTAVAAFMVAGALTYTSPGSSDE